MVHGAVTLFSITDRLEVLMALLIGADGQLGSETRKALSDRRNMLDAYLKDRVSGGSVL
jgi:hypothetical protein